MGCLKLSCKADCVKYEDVIKLSAFGSTGGGGTGGCPSGCGPVGYGGNNNLAPLLANSVGNNDSRGGKFGNRLYGVTGRIPKVSQSLGSRRGAVAGLGIIHFGFFFLGGGISWGGIRAFWYCLGGGTPIYVPFPLLKTFLNLFILRGGYTGWKLGIWGAVLIFAVPVLYLSWLSLCVNSLVEGIAPYLISLNLCVISSGGGGGEGGGGEWSGILLFLLNTLPPLPLLWSCSSSSFASILIVFF